MTSTNEQTMPATNDQPKRTSVAEEILAMQRIVAVLEGLDSATQDCIAGWLFDRYRAPFDQDSVDGHHIQWHE